MPSARMIAPIVRGNCVKIVEVTSGSARVTSKSARAAASEMSRAFQAPAILTRMSYTKDGGLSLGFTTNELTNDEKVLAAQYFQQFGYILFKPNQFTESDMPDDEAPSDESKTPSQRLRATLFVWWKQLGEPEEFESFYRKWLEKAIDRVKRLLD